MWESLLIQLVHTPALPAWWRSGVGLEDDSAALKQVTKTQRHLHTLTAGSDSHSTIHVAALRARLKSNREPGTR